MITTTVVAKKGIPLIFSALYPELIVQDVERSREFYVNFLGFSIEFNRPEEQFYFLSYGASQLMILQDNENRHSCTGPLDYPRGQGVNFSIASPSVQKLSTALAKKGYPLRIPVRDQWHRQDHIENGERQLWVMDPDGYLLRFTESLGTRPYTPALA